MPDARRLARVGAAVIVTAVLLGGGLRTPVEARALDDPPWLDRLKAWSVAVDAHVPGRADGAVVTIGAWDADSVNAVVADFLAIRHWMVKHQTGAADPNLTLTHKKHRMTWPQLEALAVFGRRERNDANPVLRRAALLHADVGLAPQLDWSRRTGNPDSILVEDGVVVGYESVSAHWGAGRRLLQEVTPDPAADPFVAQWYYATLAAMLDAGNLTAMRTHVQHAAELLPNDANVRFEQGCMHQIMASPSLQAVNRMAQRTKRMVPATRSYGNVLAEDMADHLKDAERYLRRALVLNPAHQEARLRLGFALLQLDRPADAVVELEQASTPGHDPVVRYLALMMGGTADERLGRPARATPRYEEAARLFPRARSPLFAKAAVLRRAGHRDEAWAEVSRIIEPGSAEQADADPWWKFFRWHIRSVKDVFGDLHRTLDRGVSP